MNNTCHDARPARWHLRFWALSLGVAVFSGCAGCPGRGVEDDSTSSSGGGVSSSGPASAVSLGSSSGNPSSSSGASSAGGASSGGPSGSGASGTSGTATSAQPGSSSSLSSPSSSSGASASSGGPVACGNPLNGTRYGLCNHGLELETGRIQGSRFGTQGTLAPGDVQPAVGTRFQIRGNTTVKH